MKHLIALSMKYIRRQKMRTFLTFMCITLSAFILSTVCVYCSSMFQTLMNNTIDEDGSWEVDISQWIENSDDPDKAAQAVANHAVVDKCYTSKETAASISKEDVPHGIAYFEVSVGGNNARVKRLSTYKGTGDIEIVNGKYSDDIQFQKYDTNADGVYLPYLFHNMGYSKGDTLTFTICPVVAQFDESSQVIKEVRAELKEKYGTEYTCSDPEYEELPKDVKKKAYGGKLDSYLSSRKNIDLNDLPVTDEEFGEPVEYTVKIAGFTDSQNYSAKAIPFFFSIVNTKDTDINFAELGEKNPELDVNIFNNTRIRVIDNCNYDDALKRLFTDLGFDYDTQFYDQTYFSHDENSMLLALEWKSGDAISKFMTAVIVPVLIVLLIAWFVARFVIDNAFEMAVQERSTHFAALRIMGASKGQIAFLVFAEALFYCFTAVPLGTVIAVLLCRSSFNTIRDLSVPIFEYKASAPIMAIGVALCLIAILISAYTSAMWASRKLSPAEALNFGKPKRKKIKFRKYKSKLDLSANKFLKRYTKKNIKTAKSRFIVATITMGLGVLMFTFTLLTASYFKNVLEKERDPNYADMYIIDYYSDDLHHPTEMPDKYFGNSKIFSRYDISGVIYDATFDEESIKTINDKLILIDGKEAKHPYFITINKSIYLETDLDKITGISYEDFVNSNGVLYNMNNTDGNGEEGKRTEIYERKFVKTDNITLNINNDKYNVIGAATSPAITGVIIPVERSADLYISYDITLRVSDYKHYPEAQKLYDEFISKANYSEEMNAFMVGTGVNELLNAIIKVIICFLVSIWLVGILSMVNSVNTSVLNRSRELMMLRSVGMSRKQLRKSVMLETIMFSSRGAIAGTILGAGGFLSLFIGDEKIPADAWRMVAIVVTISIIINILIALLAAIPAIKNLGKVESIAQAANG